MTTKTDRLEMRLTPENKELLEQAAAALGQPLTSFALSLLIERARAILEQRNRTTLSIRDGRRFMRILDDSEPSAALKAAARRYRKLRRG